MDICTNQLWDYRPLSVTPRSSNDAVPDTPNHHCDSFATRRNYDTKKNKEERDTP